MLVEDGIVSEPGRWHAIHVFGREYRFVPVEDACDGEAFIGLGFAHDVAEMEIYMAQAVGFRGEESLLLHFLDRGGHFVPERDFIVDDAAAGC